MHRDKKTIPEDFTLLLSCDCTFSSSNWVLSCSEDTHLCNMKRGCVPIEWSAIVHILKEVSSKLIQEPVTERLNKNKS